MTPLEEQSSMCNSISLELQEKMHNMQSLLNDWIGCDRSNEDNHWMYYKCKEMIETLQDELSFYNIEVAQAELLEGLHEKGDIILN